MAASAVTSTQPSEATTQQQSPRNSTQTDLGDQKRKSEDKRPSNETENEDRSKQWHSQQHGDSLDLEQTTAQPMADDARSKVEEKKENVQGQTPSEDPNVIGWDGPDDAENPKNFAKRKKWTLTLMFGLYAILSPLSSSMIAPCIPQMSSDLHVVGSARQNMMVSIYMAGYIVGPLCLGPLSEVYGRRPIIITANVIFIVFNILCSRASSFSEMVAFRILAGLGGAGPLSVGGGALSDVWAADERGKAVALFSIGPLLGPAIGPIAGGFMTEQGTIAGQQAWRWVFYITTMVAAVPAIVGGLNLPETFAPVLLSRKVKRMQQETGNINLRSIYHKDETVVQLIEKALVRPLIMITTQPIVVVLSLYLTILFGTYYILLVTFSRIFEERYNMTIGIASLNYLSLALGFLTGRLIGTRLMDKWYRKLRDKNGGKGQPEMRLVVMVGPCILIPTGMLIYGWTIQYRIFWIVPDIGAFIFGMGIMGTSFVVQSYTIDAYSMYAASALAATTSLRSGAAFGFPLFATKMYDTLGYGWGNSLLAFVAFVLGGPGSLAIYCWGPKLRQMSPYAAGDKY